MTMPAGDGDRDAATPELDQAVLTEFVRAVGRDGAMQVMTTLLTDLHERLAEFREGLRCNDLSLAGGSIHKLKSSVAYVGGVRLSEFCRELESHARAGNGEALRAGMAPLAARLRQIERELRGYLRS